MIPDAPYIREAELYGPPEPETVYCPVCGEEALEIYADMYGNVFACDKCLLSQDANEWANEEREKCMDED